MTEDKVDISKELDHISQLNTALSQFRSSCRRITAEAAPLYLARLLGLVEVVVGDMNIAGLKMAEKTGAEFIPAQDDWPEMEIDTINRQAGHRHGGCGCGCDNH